MPPAAKQSQTKKAGASKAKGAVRAKTGCYTCRIRRKKCDEQRTDRDTCKTCDRLRLECLGFGAKRPEWLRESSTVTVLRDRIKVFLASQGLIKGHSGSGPRTSEQNHNILRLSVDPHPNYHSSSSESPPSRSISLSSDDDHPRLVTSSIRDQRQDEEQAWFGYNQTMHNPHPRSDSPFSNESTFDDPISHPYTLSNNSSSIVDPSSQLTLTPALRSTFSHLYTERIDESSFETFEFSHTLPMDGRDLTNLLFYQSPTTYTPDGLVDQSVEHYVRSIAEIQFLLGDRATLPRMIWHSSQSHPNSQSALYLLSSIYYKRQQQPHQAVLNNTEMNSKLLQLLSELKHSNTDDPDNAIAALHGVSMFLFDGGHGAWSDFLQLASVYVKKVLHNPAFGGPRDALLFANPKDAFIVKTAVWFDVLAAITTHRPPHFFSEIQAMFNPASHGIYDPRFDTSPQCSMMSPMGCENRVVWALAETSALWHWKQNEEAKGRLSIADLVAKAGEIEHFLYCKPFEESMEPTDDREMEQIRYLASEIFRCSTRLLLASVVNGDYLQVKQIQDAVEESMEAFRALFRTGITDVYRVSRSVVRSTVFAIYITGSLTYKTHHQRFLLENLNREAMGKNGEGVGNCASIRKMLEEVWRQSAAHPTQPVPWRQILKEREILLV